MTILLDARRGHHRFLHDRRQKTLLRGLCFVFLIAPIIFMSSPAQAQAQSLKISVSPKTLTIHPGERDVPLQFSVGSDYTGPITVTLSELPSGITAKPFTLTGGGKGVLKLNASKSADYEDFPGKIFSQDHATSDIAVVAAAGAEQAQTTVALKISLSDPSYAPTSDSIVLPIVRLRTDTHKPPPQDQSDIDGTMTITSSDERKTYYDGTVTKIHIRGHSTAQMPKKSYSIKLGKKKDIFQEMGVQCPYVSSHGDKICNQKKQYALLANWDDKTLLRDWAASRLANSIPIGGAYLNKPIDSPTPTEEKDAKGNRVLMPWAPHSVYVALYLNDKYLGVYQLIERIKINKHRVNISKQKKDPDETGGYLLEIDKRGSKPYHFTTSGEKYSQGMTINLRKPNKPKGKLTQDKLNEHVGWIHDYVSKAENALYSPDFRDKDNGWRHYFDEASAVNFYIVNDVMGNQDGGHLFSSDYLYKDKNNPLLYMGPVWDFDISSGNVNYGAISNPTIPWMQNAKWYKRWFMDPGFKADVAKQFNTLKANYVFDQWLNSIRRQAAKVKQSTKNNFSRWPTLGIRVKPNPEAAGSYDGEVDYLVTYLKLRIAYLDSVFNDKSATPVTMSASSDEIHAGSPLTLKAHVTAQGAPPGTVTFLLTNRGASTNPDVPFVGPSTKVNDQGDANIELKQLRPGDYRISAVYSGDAHNALSQSKSPVSVKVLPPLAPTVTSIAASGTSTKPGQFTASVIGASGKEPPTGTLTFTAGGKTLGTATLSDGTASFEASGLPSGEAYAVHATYSGDSNYETSVSSDLKMAASDFTLKADPMAVQVHKGDTATVHLAVNPTGGFNGDVSFKCSGLPANSHCLFSPPSVTVSDGAATSTLTITTGTDSAAFGWASGSTQWLVVISLGGGLALMLLFPVSSRRRTRLAVTISMAIALGLTLSACNHHSHHDDHSQSQPTQSETYPVTVTASGKTVSHTATVKLTIQD